MYVSGELTSNRSNLHLVEVERAVSKKGEAGKTEKGWQAVVPLERLEDLIAGESRVAATKFYKDSEKKTPSSVNKWSVQYRCCHGPQNYVNVDGTPVKRHVDVFQGV